MTTESEASASRPLISIVLPAYNGATYLGQALQSCLDQSYLAWELIVVDDASTDATPAIIREFAMHDSRVSCIRHETNRRLPGALNTGFAAARGEFLTWTSDDNLYRVNAFEAMAAVLTEMPAVDFVYADFDVIDEAGRVVPSQGRVRPPQTIQ